MAGANGVLSHEEKVVEIIRRELRQARAARHTGKMIVEIELYKGDATKTQFQSGNIYKVIDEINSKLDVVYTQVGVALKTLETFNQK